MAQSLSKIKSQKGSRTTEVVKGKKHIHLESSHIKKVAFSLDSLIFARADAIEKVIRKKRILVASSACLVLLILGGIYAPKGAAESAIFYPTSCLGGWMNPGMAEEQPQTSINTAAEEFNPENSAILAADTNADIYCGSFKGDFPEKTQPTKIILALSWTTGPNINHAKAVIGTSFASSSAAILDGTSTDTVSFTLATTTETVEAVTDPQTATDSPKIEKIDTEPSLLDAIVEKVKDVVSGNTVDPVPVEEKATPQETAPSVEAVPVTPDAPTSFLDSLVRRITVALVESAYAEEISETSSISNDQIAVPDTVAPTTEPNPVLPISEENTSSVGSIDETPDAKINNTEETVNDNAPALPEVQTTEGTTTEAIIDAPAAPPVVADSSFLEVLYTFDGITWSSLGKVNEVDMVSRNFEIPVTATTTWDDMSHLQIKVQTVQRFDKTPTVYLDGIKASVMYDHISDGTHPDFARDSILQETKDNNIHAVRIKNSDTDEYEVWYLLETPIENTNLATSTWYQFTDPTTWPTRESIIYGMTDHRPPGLTARTFTRDIVVDPHATHACHVAVFSMDISGVSTSTTKIIFNEDEQAMYKVEVGSLPEGINVTFVNNGLYEAYPTQDDTSLDVQIVNQDGAGKGNFTIPFIFTKNLGHESTVLCQINLVNL